MGIFSKVSKAVKSATKGVTKAVRRIPEEARNGINSAVRLQNTITTGAVSSIVTGVQGVGQVAGAATKVLQENPLLGQALAGATGLPLGGLFGGDSGASGAGAAPTTFAPQADTPSVPTWIWLAGVGAAILAFILLRKKAT